MSTPCVLLGTSLFSIISFLLIKKKKKKKKLSFELNMCKMGSGPNRDFL